MDFETVRYETDGQIATVTLNRPEAANAQNTQMIEDIDAAFDSAEADDEVRVVILAAEGKHFSSGHDLKEILRGEEYWAALRATPEGKLLHEQVMYWDKLIRIRDFPKITIAAVQGTCTAAIVILGKSRIRMSLSQYMTCSWSSLPSGVARCAAQCSSPRRISLRS